MQRERHLACVFQSQKAVTIASVYQSQHAIATYLRGIDPNQRAAKGGLDPSWLELAFWGRPGFQSRCPQILIFKGFGDLWAENRGAPRMPNPTMTDPTPHLRLSDQKIIMT